MVQRINEIMEQSKGQLMQQETSLPSLLTTQIDGLKAAVLQKYGQEGADLLERYNPDHIFRKQLTANECFFGEYPTLGQLRAKFDSRFPGAWLIAHLYDLSEYCGCKGKLEGHALQQCASVISMEFHYLKLSELMLFFHRFKTGRYGRFYGSVDPLIITESLRKFCEERWQAYERHEQAQREQRETDSRKNAITYEQYQQMKKEGKI